MAASAPVPHCCARCALRLAGVRDVRAYTQELPTDDPAAADCPDLDIAVHLAAVPECDSWGDGEEAAGEGEEAEPGAGGAMGAAAPRTADEAAATAADGGSVCALSLCPLCLGLLQVGARTPTVRRLCVGVRECGFSIGSFAMTATIPPSLIARQRAAWLHARRPVADGATAPAVARRYDEVTDLKEVFRWLLSGAIAAELGVPFDALSPLTLAVSADHALTADEHVAALGPYAPDAPRASKRARGRRAARADEDAGVMSVRGVTRAMATTGADDALRASPLCPPPPAASPPRVTLAVEHAAHCMGGKYVKHSRVLPQTAWVIDGKRKCEGSVQEMIDAPAIDLFRASSARFHSAGREDVDVRMLGEGRPFVLELIGPKAPNQTAEAYAELAAEIRRRSGGVVEVSELGPVPISMIATLIKAGEDAHRKDYRCVVRASRTLTADDVALLNGTRELQLDQLTPLRVLHRRTLAVRPRTIHAMTARLIGPRFMQLDLTTQAGTYVKEFVHGDFGRTAPSVGSLLGCHVDIVQLDVLGLHAAPGEVPGAGA